ncbi:MAG TPA: L-serine ammonia-lyase [Anaeromyxobacteraceae bacterium]|nr:L-serine ammonia-lyase [Anaeromyxobacteraceae bacterium]
MPVSVLELFRVGIGPSSSHTVGPMRAARLFAVGLCGEGALGRSACVRVELFGSLGATGRGHGTDRAVVLGLMGELPESVDLGKTAAQVSEARASGRLLVQGRLLRLDLRFERKVLPRHPNALRFTALDDEGVVLASRTFYSVGGGFVVGDEPGEIAQEQAVPLPHPFRSAAELLASCERTGLSVSQIVLANERALRRDGEIEAGLARIWEVMRDCMRRGCEAEGTLPGGLGVVRRAPRLFARLRASSSAAERDPLIALDFVTLWALAVSEENAAGGRVVTAPTNGACGVVPAVMQYHRHFHPGSAEQDMARFLLAASAIGSLCKENASISGAEVGCQGEVGSACAMAAGALCEVMGGSPAQVENAAEIAMEHHLGLTCDPVGGLVQVPCIERNAAAAVQAIHAARMALSGDGQHVVSLDAAIETMRRTGADMKSKYKETARGGLAVTAMEASKLSVGIPEC